MLSALDWSHNLLFYRSSSKFDQIGRSSALEIRSECLQICTASHGVLRVDVAVHLLLSYHWQKFLADN